MRGIFLWAGTSAALIGLVVMLHPAFPRSPLLKRLIHIPKVGNLIGSLINAVLLYQQRRAIVVLTVLISIVGHFGTLSSFYFCALAINAGNAAPGYWTQLLLIPDCRTLRLRGAGPGRNWSPRRGDQVLLRRGQRMPSGRVGVTAAQAGAAGLGAALANRLATVSSWQSAPAIT